MKLIIKGSPKEIAALVLAIQERHEAETNCQQNLDDVVKNRCKHLGETATRPQVKKIARSKENSANGEQKIKIGLHQNYNLVPKYGAQPFPDGTELVVTHIPCNNSKTHS